MVFCPHAKVIRIKALEELVHLMSIVPSYQTSVYFGGTPTAPANLSYTVCRAGPKSLGCISHR